MDWGTTPPWLRSQPTCFSTWICCSDRTGFCRRGAAPQESGSIDHPREASLVHTLNALGSRLLWGGLAGAGSPSVSWKSERTFPDVAKAQRILSGCPKSQLDLHKIHPTFLKSLTRNLTDGKIDSLQLDTRTIRPKRHKNHVASEPFRPGHWQRIAQEPFLQNLDPLNHNNSLNCKANASSIHTHKTCTTIHLEPVK